MTRSTSSGRLAQGLAGLDGWHFVFKMSYFEAHPEAWQDYALGPAPMLQASGTRPLNPMAI
jgi:hypothetical protein